jgi:DnaJ like chaperone protein
MIFKAHAPRYFFWGKLMGAVLGFLTAGPLGALMGVFVGNLFDKGLNEHLLKTNNTYRIEKDPAIKQAFLHATFSNLGHIAKVDGRVSEAEIHLAKQIMNELHLNKSEQTAAKRFFQEGKQTQFRVTQSLTPLKNLLYEKPKLLHAFVQLLYRMAQTDGLSPEKVTSLNMILNELGLAPLHQQPHARRDYYAQFHQKYNQYKHQSEYTEQTQQAHQEFYTSQTLESSYRLLGLSSSATQAEVKRAYRRLISKHHPDKCIAAGMSEQRIKAANEKTQAIRKAYEHICEVKGV